MRTIINLAPLTKLLCAKADNSTMVIATLQDAGLYIQKYGVAGQLHWETAAAAVDHADKNPKLVEHATRSLENALQTDRLLRGI